MRGFSSLFIVIVFFYNISRGQEKIRATEGWLDNSIVKFDTTTSVKELIERLKLPWQFVETGKAYWIGYTDDMYSIARYKSTVVPLLIQFIDSSTATHAKVGALYTLHLIGVNSKIEGRFYEKFLDTIARKAILKYFSSDSLHEHVVSLLMRDPWPMDIRYYIDYLSQSHNNYVAALSALARYPIKNRPICQHLPDSISKRMVILNTQEKYSRDPISDMIALKKEYGNVVEIADEIITSPEWLEQVKQLSHLHVKRRKIETGDLLEYFGESPFSFCDFDNEYFYVFEGGKIKIYGQKNTRELWLSWWTNKD